MVTGRRPDGRPRSGVWFLRKSANLNVGLEVRVLRGKAKEREDLRAQM